MEHQDFPSKSFCLTVPKTSLGESFTVAIFSGIEKVWIRGGEYQDFASKVFCLTVPKSFVGEPFSVSLSAGTEKVWIGEGGVSSFSVEKFLSHSAENFRRRTFYCFTNCGYRKSLDKRWGEHQDFPSIIFCLTVPKVFVEEPFSVSLIAGTENVWIREGNINIFRQKFFVSQCRKLP